MKKTLSVSAFTASVLASFAAQATNTAELIVKGTIHPAACTPILDNAGVVDYGTIDSTQISASQPTALGEKRISFSINCSSAAPFALRLIDNQASSVVPGLAKNLAFQAPVPDDRAYGLGTVDGKNIGVYTVQVGSADGTRDMVGTSMPAFPISGNGSTWSNSGYFLHHFAANGLDHWKAFGSPLGSTTPLAWTSITGKLTISTMIDKRSNLPLQHEIDLKGSATLEVMYL